MQGWWWGVGGEGRGQTGPARPRRASPPADNGPFFFPDHLWELIFAALSVHGAPMCWNVADDDVAADSADNDVATPRFLTPGFKKN